MIEESRGKERVNEKQFRCLEGKANGNRDCEKVKEIRKNINKGNWKIKKVRRKRVNRGIGILKRRVRTWEEKGEPFVENPLRRFYITIQSFSRRVDEHQWWLNRVAFWGFGPSIKSSMPQPEGGEEHEKMRKGGGAESALMKRLIWFDLISDLMVWKNLDLSKGRKGRKPTYEKLSSDPLLSPECKPGRTTLLEHPIKKLDPLLRTIHLYNFFS